MKRFLLAFLLALAGLLVFAGSADAKTPPLPENPLANAGRNAFSPKPDPPPPPNQAWDPNDLLSYYGTAGPLAHYYDLNPLEEVGASMWVELENDAMDLPKMTISADASFATWVFNPASWLDQLAAPTNETSSLLADQVTKPWLPVVLVFVAIAITWGARRGLIHVAMTRIAFVFLGLGLIGLSVLNPAGPAGWASTALSNIVSGVLVPTVQQVDDNVKSDADAAAYAYAKKQAQASVGTKMLGPIYNVGVYRPWLMMTLGSASSKTANDYGPALFQGQAFTWREADAVEGNKDATKTLAEKDQQAWTAAAAKVNDTDPNAYRYLQGSETSIAPIFVAYMVCVTALPFLTVALLMTFAGYMGLHVVAALLPIIGLAILLWPGIARRIGLFVLAILVNTVVFATASVVITKFAGALFSGSNVLLAGVLVLMASIVAWLLLKAFRGFHPVAVEQLAAPTVSVKGVKEKTRKTKQVVKSATKQKSSAGGVAASSNGSAPAAVDEASPPPGAVASKQANGSEPAAYVPIRSEPAAEYAPIGRRQITRWDLDMSKYKPGEQPAVEEGGDVEDAPAPSRTVEPVAAQASRRGHPQPHELYVPDREASASVSDVEAEPPGASRAVPPVERVPYEPEPAEGVVA